MNKFYITTPIYYANGTPHIGNAYTTIAADILNRYHRMLGKKTFFLVGTDEHGEKNEESARAVGLEPQKFVDQNSAKFQLTWDFLGLTYNRFIRTTEKEHITAVSKALQQLYNKGYIYQGKHEGLYCIACEQYKTERDLVDGKCPDHKTKPELKSEEGYMFKLSVFADELKKKIESDEMKIRPVERKNEVLAFYSQGLKDISFSRKNLKWGVPLPWDTDHVSYVWPEAFLNYLIGLGWDGAAGEAPDLWPADVQLVGKDIIRVHATIWPAMLLGLDLPLPKQFFVNGFLTIDGQKMSKTIGNVIDPVEVSQEFGLDILRYFLFREIPFSQDGDFSLQRLAERYNSELVNGLGNLVARVLSMAEKYCDNRIPEDRKPGESEIRNFFASIIQKYDEAFVNIELHLATEIIHQIVTFFDGYIQKYKPWQLVKDDLNKTQIIMYDLLEGLRQIAWLCLPIMPETAEKIFIQLGLYPAEEMKKSFVQAVAWGGLLRDGIIKRGEVLFPRKQ